MKTLKESLFDKDLSDKDQKQFLYKLVDLVKDVFGKDVTVSIDWLLGRGKFPVINPESLHIGLGNYFKATQYIERARKEIDDVEVKVERPKHDYPYHYVGDKNGIFWIKFHFSTGVVQGLEYIELSEDFYKFCGLKRDQSYFKQRQKNRKFGDPW